MTSFARLSDLVVELRAIARKFPAEARENIVEAAAAALLSSRYAGAIQVGAHSMINVAAAAVAMADQLVVHEVRGAAARLVRETEITSVPRLPPKLLRHPCLVEVAHPEREYLVDLDEVRIVGLAAYEVDGQKWLIGWRYPDGILVSAWGATTPGATDVDEIPWREVILHGATREEFETRALACVEWLYKLGLLLEAEGSPLARADESGGKPPKGKPAKPRRPGEGWTVRHVSLTSPEKKVTAASTTAPTTSAEVPSDREGLVLSETHVRGHLKQQAYGVGLKERKTIYVAPYISSRWISEQRKVTVHG